MASDQSKKPRYHPLARDLPAGREKEICPVCRQDFADHEGKVILCPAPGCNLMYHDFGDGENCWDMIDRCARAGCNGKDLDKARSKKRKDKENIRYFVKRITAGENISESEMLVFAQLLREYPSIELSPVVLKKVAKAVKGRNLR